MMNEEQANLLYQQSEILFAKGDYQGSLICGEFLEAIALEKLGRLERMNSRMNNSSPFLISFLYDRIEKAKEEYRNYKKGNESLKKIIDVRQHTQTPKINAREAK